LRLYWFALINFTHYEGEIGFWCVTHECTIACPPKQILQKQLWSKMASVH
jgi:hypothetical protein